MRTLLICHHDAPLDRVVLARWLAATSELAGLLVIQEPPGRLHRRVKREIQRVGPLRFLDVMAFRVYQRVHLAERDGRWEAEQVERLSRVYPELPADLPVLLTRSPSSEAARDFIARCRPDLMLARCKSLLKEEVFSIPTKGTFVMHPGICPEYRNAHGCFWALASGDLDRVGMTLLRIDRGVDTGPIFGYFHTAMDELAESHFVIQNRVVLDNLPQIADLLQRIDAGTAVPIQTAGRSSRAWGQPWLSSYLRWKHQARRRSRARQYATLS